MDQFQNYLDRKAQSIGMERYIPTEQFYNACGFKSGKFYRLVKDCRKMTIEEINNVVKFFGDSLQDFFNGK